MKRITAYVSFLAIILACFLAAPEVARAHTEQGHTIQDAIVDWFIPLGTDRSGASWFILLDDAGWPAEIVSIQGKPCWYVQMESCGGSRRWMAEEYMDEWSFWSASCGEPTACPGGGEPYVWMTLAEWMIPCVPDVAVRPRRANPSHPARRYPWTCDQLPPCTVVVPITVPNDPPSPGPIDPNVWEHPHVGCTCDPCPD